jgi:hypothetical protein
MKTFNLLISILSKYKARQERAILVNLEVHPVSTTVAAKDKADGQPKEMVENAIIFKSEGLGKSKSC